MKMKSAICCRCGNLLEGMVPDDAEAVTCFKCSETLFSDPSFERFMDAMDGVSDVLNGKREKPGGALCVFPRCSCRSPWEQCEKGEI